MTTENGNEYRESCFDTKLKLSLPNNVDYMLQLIEADEVRNCHCGSDMHHE